MVNYSNGKIYKIESIHGGEEGDVYVGSTTAPSLSIRMAQHRCDYKGWKEGKHGKLTSYILFEKYGVENCHIVLLESVNANNKDELFARERHWIQSLRCVNKFIPGRNKKEYQQDTKETRSIVIKKWYEANKDNRSIKGKLYAKEHSEAIRIRKKQYYLDNKEHIKQYYLDNKEHILERCKQYQLREKLNTQS